MIVIISGLMEIPVIRIRPKICSAISTACITGLHDKKFMNIFSIMIFLYSDLILHWQLKRQIEARTDY